MGAHWNFLKGSQILSYRHGPNAFPPQRDTNPGNYCSYIYYHFFSAFYSKRCKNNSTSNNKIVETNALFPVISDVPIVNTHLPPSPLINVVMDLVMTFKVTSNNIERGRGGSEMYFSFPFAFKSAFLDGKTFFLHSVSTILQLLVALVMRFYHPKQYQITNFKPLKDPMNCLSFL